MISRRASSEGGQSMDTLSNGSKNQSIEYKLKQKKKIKSSSKTSR